VKLCSIFALLHAVSKMEKQVVDATDNIQKNVVRNCGMWVIWAKFGYLSVSIPCCPLHSLFIGQHGITLFFMDSMDTLPTPMIGCGKSSSTSMPRLPPFLARVKRPVVARSAGQSNICVSIGHASLPLPKPTGSCSAGIYRRCRVVR
jgi:hypothetical protein